MSFFPSKGGFVPASTASEDPDDLYGGFDYSIEEPAGAVVAGGAFGGGGGNLAPVNPTGYNFSSMGKPPSTASARGIPPGTASRNNQAPPGTAMRIAMAQQSGDGPRPMTSVKGAGFTASGKGNNKFDPLNQGVSRGPAPPLVEKSDNSPEDMAKEMERGVNKILEESAKAAYDKDFVKALEAAKEAGKKERALCKHRESNGLAEQVPSCI
jgi:hypothetical protein